MQMSVELQSCTIVRMMSQKSSFVGFWKSFAKYLTAMQQATIITKMCTHSKMR